MFITAMIATNPTNIAATITATLNPSKIYSPSTSKKVCFFSSSTTKISSSADTEYGFITDAIMNPPNKLRTIAVTTYLGCNKTM